MQLNNQLFFQLKLNLMKEKGKWSLYGPYLKYIIKSLVIYMICITEGKRLAKVHALTHCT